MNPEMNAEIKKYEKFMKEAVNEAKKGVKEGGEPIGAVLVLNGKIIGRGHNQYNQKKSVILHAEMDCLENAGQIGSKNYAKCTLYTTLSPCDMCSGAILLYKIPQVVIGENENYKGPEKYLEERGVELINLDLDGCKKTLADFIKKNPKTWAGDIGE